MRRQVATAPWSPDRSTSGTSHPRNEAGRVYWGYSSSPALKLSSWAESSLPRTPGQEAGHRLEHDQRRQLPTRQHEVAHRQLAVDQVVRHPLVHPFVAPAQQREAAAGRVTQGRQLGCHVLVEAAASGGQEVERTRQVGDGFDAAEERLGHEHHAGAAAEGAVVDGAAGVVRALVAGRAPARRAPRRRSPARGWRHRSSP